MATTVGVSPGPERTRALLEEIAGGRRGAQLRGQVAAVKRGATREQIEEAFQEACLKAARSCRGQTMGEETMGEVYKWLLRTTDSTVDDMRDRLKREVLVDHGAREFRTVDPSLASPDDVLIKREERAELDALVLAILERLDERERQVAVLHSHGLARNDIARHLGVTPRIVKRDVKGILKTGRAQLARTVGCGCPDGQRLISRYAFGLAAGREAQRAQLHLATCARCVAMYERLDQWRERVAALLPMPPAAAGAHSDVVQRVVHVGRDVLTPGPSAGDGVGGLRHHISSAAGYVRDHATMVLARTADPTPLAGVRPGAVAAAVAGCIAVGGGATYCVQQGSDPITALSRLTAPAHHHTSKPTQRTQRARAAQAPPVAIATPPAPSAYAQTPPPPPPPAVRQANALAPAPQDEFEPTSVSAGTAHAPSTPSVRRRPAPAPAGGVGEFGGP